MTTMLDAALDYAKHRWPVFPCSQNTKQPLTPKGTPGKKDGGLYLATDDERKIRPSWSRYKDAMIGVRTGPSIGAFVVDLDVRGGMAPATLKAQLEAAIGVKLPPCPIVRTPRPGGGWHLYFKLPPCVEIRNRANILGAKGDADSKIDIRGEGGYVIMPPSVRQGGQAVRERCNGVAYAWLDDDSVDRFNPPLPPQALIDFILRQGKFKRFAESGDTSGPPVTPGRGRPPRVAADHDAGEQAVRRYAQAALTGMARDMAATPEGERGETLNKLAFIVAPFVTLGAVSEREAVAALRDAADASGVTAKDGATERDAKIRRGLDAGRGNTAKLAAKFDEIRKEAAARAPKRKGRSSGATGGGAGGAGGGGAAEDDKRPIIRVVAGEHAAAADEAEAALCAAAVPEIFQRGGMLVHIGKRPMRRSDGTKTRQEAIVGVTLAALADRLSRTCRFECFDKRSTDWRASDPPKNVVEALHARPDWRLPDLRQIVVTPTLRPDGSLLVAPGYDAKTGLYLARDLPGLNVPDHPTHNDALRADELLTEVFREFPFAPTPEDGEACLSLAVVKAALLTALIRHLLPHAPLFAISAPTAGTGKSYLVDVIAMIATGRRAATMGIGKKEEDFNKAFTAALLEGRPVLSFDNLNRPLGGEMLCRVMTQEGTSERVLGVSKMVDLPTAVTLFATGNNLSVHDDMARRTLVCQLDSGAENPEEREFEVNLLEEVERRRGELVSAGLTILRWNMQSNPAEPAGARHLGGFEVWARLVRDPLIALDNADAATAVDLAKGTDQARERRAQFLAVWHDAFAADPITAGEAVRRVSARDSLDAPLYPDRLDAFLAVGRGPRSRDLSADSLGRYLAKNANVPTEGYCIRRAGVRHKQAIWAVKKTE